MENKKIRNVRKCETDNIKFKSQLERTIYNTLKEKGLNPQYEPTTFTLWDEFRPITPFYDKETDSQHKKRLNAGEGPKTRLLMKKDSKITGIRYTPDFYFPYGDIEVFIEAKGMENDVFYIKKKMFRKYLDRQLEESGKHSIFFEIYTKTQLLQALEIIKEYEQSIKEDGTTDSIITT